MTTDRRRATLADYQQLCQLAARRELAVELVASTDTVGTNDLTRRLQTRLRLVPRAVTGAKEVAGTPVHPTNVYEAARRILDRMTISEGAR